VSTFENIRYLQKDSLTLLKAAEGLGESWQQVVESISNFLGRVEFFVLSNGGIFGRFCMKFFTGDAPSSLVSKRAKYGMGQYRYASVTPKYLPSWQSF